MTQRRLTLTDVMIGIDKHGLVDKLTDESFKFLIGMILEHNRVGFKPGFDMTNNQAMAAGGGNTPKSVRRRRLTLSKFKIDGKPLLKFYTGNYGRNTCAKYDINYFSLCSYNGVWSTENARPTQKRGSSGEGEGRVEGTVEGTVEAPSLDQIREDERRPTPQSPPNDVTTQTSSTDENGGGGDLDSQGEEDKPKMITLAKNLQDLILRKWKGQISKGPDIGKCKDAIREYGYPLLMGAVAKSPDTLDHQNPRSALNCVIGRAKLMESEGNGGVSKEFFQKREQQLEEMKTALENAKEYPEKNADFIDQQTERIGMAEASLQRLREG